MPHLRTRLLLMAATLVSGILAGGIVDRVIVGGPAWRQLGVEAWVQYSRLADLGTGLVAYPVEGIGAALLIVAASVSAYFDPGVSRHVTLPLYAAVALAAAGCCLLPRRRRSCSILPRRKPRPPASARSMNSSCGGFISAAPSTCWRLLLWSGRSPTWAARHAQPGHDRWTLAGETEAMR
jgi:hypothetical protein